MIIRESGGSPKNCAARNIAQFFGATPQINPVYSPVNPSPITPLEVHLLHFTWLKIG